MSTVTIPTSILLYAASRDANLTGASLRVLTIILAYTAPGGPVPLAQTELATLLDIHKPAVSRAMQILRLAGILTKHPGSHLFTLTDPDAPSKITDQ